MAKAVKSISFTNACIDVLNDEIVEFRKDEVITSSLSQLLKDWDGTEGVTLTIRQETATQVKAGTDES